MNLIKRANENDLTEDEIQFLRSSTTVPEEVKHYLTRQHENLGVKSSAMRKVAAAARAEREAIIEVRALSIVKGEASEASEARRRAALAEQHVQQLEQRCTDQQREITNLIARPALAVHSSTGH